MYVYGIYGICIFIFMNYFSPIFLDIIVSIFIGDDAKPFY